MATVKVFTADRMQDIENSAVVDGTVVGDNLILSRYDASTIDAGSVRGIQGIQGFTGEISQAVFDAAIATKQSEIDALEADVVTLQGEVSTLQSEASTHQTAFDAFKDEMYFDYLAPIITVLEANHSGQYSGTVPTP